MSGLAAPATRRHHWIIEGPEGLTSLGRCKLCGAARAFRNSAEDYLRDDHSASSSDWHDRGFGWLHDAHTTDPLAPERRQRLFGWIRPAANGSQKYRERS